MDDGILATNILITWQMIPFVCHTTEPVNLETNSTLIPLLCSDTSEDMRVIHNSYFSNTFNGIGEAIGLIGFGSCEEVDELEKLAPGIIVNPNHSLFEKDQVYKNKCVLTSALKRHSILKHFQFKTTRSSSIRSKVTFSGFHLGKKYENILRRNKTTSEKLRIVEANKYVYTVLDSITQFTVCLHQRTCTCGRFQLDELPCPHALAVLTIKHTGYEKYCSDYYTRKNLLLTYQFHMDPLPDESTWNTPTHVLEVVVLPPHGKRPPGPKNKRHTQLREDGLKKAKITCSN
ncbi:hypothetical protein H5410_013412, partial [Solanum commersonii]